MQTYHIIGISDDDALFLPPEVEEVVREHRVFSGGRRHYELVRSRLPEGSTWINITVPLDRVFEQYAPHREIVVFASGDPLFFGFANTVKRICPEAKMVVYPSFNSLQMLAHRMLLAYQDMHMVSLTGRPWHAFDAALISGERLVGVLTDREKSPTAIARRMMEYGYTGYRMTVGEKLGNRREEQVRTFALEEAVRTEFCHPNCLILEKTDDRQRPFGIPEQEFHLLDGRTRMITKMSVRLLTLSMLGLRQKTSLWDIGFCTGSVSIEARLQFPHLHVTAFEQRPEGKALMEANSRKFGAPGITTLIGDFLEQDLHAMLPPDAVFIGGHGGRLIEILQRIHQVLLPGGTIVFNSVSKDSLALFREGVASIGRRITGSVCLTVDQHNPIEIIKAE